LLSDLADSSGLTEGLSVAMAPTKQGRRGHDRGQVVVDVAVMIADGGDAISDLVVLRNPPEFPAASRYTGVCRYPCSAAASTVIISNPSGHAVLAAAPAGAAMATAPAAGARGACPGPGFAATGRDRPTSYRVVAPSGATVASSWHSVRRMALAVDSLATARIRRSLKPDLGCLRRNRGWVWASA
jgi:hypothetical protein